MTLNQERDKIKAVMTEHDIKAGTLIMASGFTGVRYFLNDGNIQYDNLEKIKAALKRLIAVKQS